MKLELPRQSSISLRHDLPRESILPQSGHFFLAFFLRLCYTGRGIGRFAFRRTPRSGKGQIMIILEKEKSETSRSYAIRVLLYNIIHLELPPGASISENEVSAALSVSRTPVREALIELNRTGLVEILPQRGSYVAKIDYDIVEESRFFRLVMENAVLKLACAGIEDRYYDALTENLELQRQAFHEKKPELLLELDNKFHALIFESVNKLWSYRIVKEQMVHFDRLRVLSSMTMLQEYTLRDHEDILYALKRRDAEMAEMMMTRHLTRHIAERKLLFERHPDYFV